MALIRFLEAYLSVLAQRVGWLRSEFEGDGCLALGLFGINRIGRGGLPVVIYSFVDLGFYALYTLWRSVLEKLRIFSFPGLGINATDYEAKTSISWGLAPQHPKRIH